MEKNLVFKIGSFICIAEISDSVIHGLPKGPVMATNHVATPWGKGINVDRNSLK